MTVFDLCYMNSGDDNTKIFSYKVGNYVWEGPASMIEERFWSENVKSWQVIDNNVIIDIQ